VPQKGKHRENEEDDEKYLGSFPREGCHASEAKEGSDQSDDEKRDSEMQHGKFSFKTVGSVGTLPAEPVINISRTSHGLWGGAMA
jgi:hypothetical protein